MIVLLVGKSASGKDTYLHEFTKVGYKPIISYTTRPIRDGEEDGVDYNFVSEEEFNSLIEENKILEYRSYNTLYEGKPEIWYYGSPKINAQQNYVGVVDVDGANTYIEKYGEENITVIYIYVSDEVRTERAKLRGSFDETEWNRRLADDNIKIERHLINTNNIICIDNEVESIEDNMLKILFVI